MANDNVSQTLSQLKTCNACGIEKELDKFYIRKETGLPKNRCKRCTIDGKTMIRLENSKICKHCGVEKPFSEYQKAGGGKWLQPYCKPCDSQRKKGWASENADLVKDRAREYYETNKDQIAAKGKQERLVKRPETLKRIRAFIDAKKMPIQEKKRRKSECDRRYREKTAETLKAKKKAYGTSEIGRKKAREWQERKMADPDFVTKKRLRGRIYVALKRSVKSESTMKLLGCSIEFFKEYFQSKFTEGMNWEVYMKGGIHIDHIKPCKEFDLTDPAQQKLCFHYTNLQPLWELDNLKKGASYEKEILCPNQ